MSRFWLNRSSYESVNQKEICSADKDSPSSREALLESIMGQGGSVSFEERALFTLRESEQSILNCEVGPDGKTLATCSADGTIYLWNLTTGEFLRSLKGHDHEVTSCSFSGPILASASQDGVVILWIYNTGRRASKLAVHSGPVFDCVFAKDGRALATCSKDCSIRHFKIKPGKGEFVLGTETRVLAGKHGHRAPVNAVAFSPDNKFIFSGCENGIIKKWSREDAKCLETATGSNKFGPIRGIRFSSSEEIFASLSGSSVVIWNVGEVTVVRQVLDVPGSRQIQAISFVPDSAFLVGVSSDNNVCIWEPMRQHSKAVIRPTEHEGGILSCCFDPQGRYFITSDSRGFTQIWV